MRKLFLLAFFVISVIAHARQISEDEAASFASEFFDSAAIMRNASKPTLHRVPGYNSDNTGNVPYYVFNASDNKGFVIISGDDRLPLYLAYSTKNPFDYDKFLKYFPKYFKNIEKLVQEKSDISSFTDPASICSNSVEPLLKTTWDQGFPYNILTPIWEDNTHCSTGAGNTAQAQIMKYWNYPDKGAGIVSYEWNRNNETLSQDLSLSHYQWDIMQNNYESLDNISDESCNAVATLIRDCGYANGTDYSPNSSMTLNFSSLVRNFGYDKAIRIYDGAICSRKELEDAMYSELNAGRPFFFNGLGLQLVCDGYDENRYFHFNFSMGGLFDGYYLIPDLINNTKDISIVTGIQPDCGGEPTLTFGSDSDFKYVNGKIECYLCIYNPLGIFWDSLGDIYNEVATICENTETHQIYTFTKRANTDFYIIEDMPLPSDVPDGNYIIYPALRFKNGGWNKFSFHDNLQKEINLCVKDGIYSYTNEGIIDSLDNGKVEVEGIYYILNSDNTAIVTCKNDKYDSYHGDITIPSTITVNGDVYKVEQIGTNAFRKCSLDTLVIGANIKLIYDAFYSCSIQSLVFVQPSSLEYILGWGFNACTVNEMIKLPMGLKSIGTCAFQTIFASQIDIPSSVEYIDGMAFNASHDLKEVYVHWKIKDEFPLLLRPNEHIFRECKWDELTLYVPKGTASLYSDMPQWKDLKIEEYDESGVNEMNVDERDVMRIYNINGIKIPESKYNSLGSGLYIINGNKVLIR